MSLQGQRVWESEEEGVTELMGEEEEREGRRARATGSALGTANCMEPGRARIAICRGSRPPMAGGCPIWAQAHVDPATRSQETRPHLGAMKLGNCGKFIGGPAARPSGQQPRPSSLPCRHVACAYRQP